MHIYWCFRAAFLLFVTQQTVCAAAFLWIWPRVWSFYSADQSAMRPRKPKHLQTSVKSMKARPGATRWPPEWLLSVWIFQSAKDFLTKSLEHEYKRALVSPSDLHFLLGSEKWGFCGCWFHSAALEKVGCFIHSLSPHFPTLTLSFLSFQCFWHLRQLRWEGVGKSL